MEWSLVLASQGIEHWIDHAHTTGWMLSVTEADHDQALAQIGQYRLENRHWRWRQPVFQPGMFFDWGCLGWVGLKEGLAPILETGDIVVLDNLAKANLDECEVLIPA